MIIMNDAKNWNTTFNSIDNFVFGSRKERFKAVYSVDTDGKKYVIKVYLPGVKKENIALSLDKKNNLIVSALSLKEEEVGLKCIYSNIHYGEIFTVINFPYGFFKVEDCEAKFEKGILTVNINIPSLKVSNNKINIL